MLRLLIVESGGHTLSCTTAVFFIPFLRSSLSLIALCAPCDLFDSPFCLLRFPYSRGWDLRTRCPLPSPGPRLILPRAVILSYSARGQSVRTAASPRSTPLVTLPFITLLLHALLVIFGVNMGIVVS